MNEFLKILRDAMFVQDSGRIIWRHGSQSTIETMPYVIQLVTHILSKKDKNDEEKNDETDMKPVVRRALLELTKKNTGKAIGVPPKYTNIIENISKDDWVLLRRYSRTITDISNWEIYDNAIDIVEDVNIEEFAKRS